MLKENGSVHETNTNTVWFFFLLHKRSVRDHVHIKADTGLNDLFSLYDSAFSTHSASRFHLQAFQTCSFQ